MLQIFNALNLEISPTGKPKVAIKNVLDIGESPLRACCICEGQRVRISYSLVTNIDIYVMMSKVTILLTKLPVLKRFHCVVQF